MKTCFYLYISILLLTVSTFAQTATPPSGTGTASDPYLIATLNNLYWVTQNSSQWTKVYKQTADIDASTTSLWDSPQGFSPIGTTPSPFSGTYDGQSYKIIGLFINRSSTVLVGLFGYTSSAAISNVTLQNANVTGIASTGGLYVGALIGYETVGTTVTHCSSSGSVTAAYQYSSIGGLIGYQEYGSTVQSSYSMCSVSGTGSLSVVGGLVGWQQYASTVTQCYSAGSVSVPSGSNAIAGGLVGRQNGEVVYNSAYCSITNCYSTSTVSGGYTVGGLVGNQETNTSVTNCYSAGAVTGSTSSTVGGLMGSRSGTVTNSFWDTQTSAQTTSSGGTGKTTTEMKTQSTFIAAGWDGSIWNMGDGINDGYPYLDWQNPSGTPLTVDSLPSTNGLIAYYPFNGNANDESGNGNHGIVYTAALTSDRFGNSNKAYSFNGQTDYISSTNQISNPFPLSIALWFKTTTTNGGKLFGFGESQTGSSTNHDRNIYMTNSGNISFGVWTGSYQVLKSVNSYNDGNWHLVVGIISTQGLMLYIDNSSTAHDYSVISAQNLTGYWRIGYDNLAFWPDEPTSRFFEGSIDDIRIYSRAISASEIITLYLDRPTDIKDMNSTLPVIYNLCQNYPNPFNPSTSISFSLPRRSFVSLKVFDALGREVSNLVSEELPAGTYAHKWNAASMPSGVYFYRMQAGSYSETKKIVLVR